MPEQGRQRVPNLRLRQAREARNWTQLEVADALGTTKLVVGRWERGERIPRRFYWTRLCELFGKSAAELGLLANPTQESPSQDTSERAIPLYWNVPYRRNLFFTGRAEVLHQLHTALSHTHTALLSQSYALSGLGGIGKTQTALEYIYRYANDYSAVFWINAETSEDCISSMLAIAPLLNLPEKLEQDQEKVVAAVLRWLVTHSGWLLIFDNVEDPARVKRFLPAARSGSLLFTSRRQSLGLDVQILDLEPMTPEEGMRFLLYRTRRLDITASLDALKPAEATHAREIVAAMDGLPLALDQAAAYIEASQCSLPDYLQLFHASQLRLLNEREAHADHPLSVTKTFALMFEHMEQSDPSAVEMLIVCAHLSPEAIPETLFIEGAAHLGPTFERLAADPFAFHAVVKTLLTYSLLQRDSITHTLTIHRLVQAVLKGHLSEEAQRTWAVRVVRVMSQLFPANKTQVDYWKVCDQLLSHALVCIPLGERLNTDVVERITLMCHVANYHVNCAQFDEAEQLCQRALLLGEQTLGFEHPLIAEALKGLASIFYLQGKYGETKQFCQRALRIEEQTLGPEDPRIAGSLNNLAILYAEQGEYREYEEAEALFQRALRIWEQALGPEHPRVTTSIHNLGAFYLDQGKYEKAEPLLQHALHVEEQALGPEDPDVAFPLTNLGNLYCEQGKYVEAESFYQRALHIREHALGTEHQLVAEPLTGVATIYREQERYEEAEALYRRVLRVWGQAQEVDHPLITEPLIGLATLYLEQKKYKDAEVLYQRALSISEHARGSEHFLLAAPLQGLAQILTEQGEYAQAEPLFQRALTLRQQRLGPQHPYVAEILYHLARFHQMQQHSTEALALYQQVLTLREQALGTDHPKTRATRTVYMHLLREQEHMEEVVVVED